MRVLLTLIICLGMLDPALADAKPSKTEQRNRKKAQKEYVAAMDSIRSGDIGKARELLEDALTLDPASTPAITARELIRQNDIQQRVSEATRALQSKQDAKA